MTSILERVTVEGAYQHQHTYLSPVAAVGVVARAVTSHQDCLQTKFSEEQIEHAVDAFFQAGQYQGGAAFTSHRQELVELRASNPYCDDYPDVRGQRVAQLDESIAIAEEADGVELPQIGPTDLKIALCGVALAAISGSAEARDVLQSPYMEHATQIVAGAVGLSLLSMATD